MDLNDESDQRDAEPLPAVVRSEGGDSEVPEWVIGLPSGKELIPLSQWLVSHELASAFSIPPPDLKTLLDIHCAAHQTLSNLCSSSSSRLKPTSADDEDPKASLPAEDSSSSTRMPKRPRLVWTPHLHKRFVDVVSHLGIKNAVPKTIMQLMNVDGLTRENVASHLQKYRLYLKRQGLSDDAPSSSDHLLPHSLQDHQPPLPYAVPTFIPMPVYSMPHHHAHGIVPVNAFHSIPPNEPSDWSGGSKLASAVTYPHVLPNDKYK